MSKKTRTLTLSALFSALCVVTLYIASVWPTGQYGIVAFASLFIAASVIETGLKQGIYVFIVTSALALLLLPDKSAALLHVLFFGYYPILKNLIEKVKNTIVRWFLKLLIFNIPLTIIWFLFKMLLPAFGENVPAAAIVYLFGNAVFILFDYGYSNVLRLYEHRLRS